MCSSECKCEEKQGDGRGVQVAHLRRLVWVQMLWCFFLSVGLTTSIWLYLFFPKVSNATDVLTPMSPQENVLTNSCCKTQQQISEIISYDYIDNDKGSIRGDELQWQKMFHERQTTATLEVPEDSFYFLYLQVTLNSRTDLNKDYKINVSKYSDNNPQSATTIMKGHIRGTDLSSGLMGKGFILTKGTTLTVTCSPSAQLDTKETYLGMIKLGKATV